MKKAFLYLLAIFIFCIITIPANAEKLNEIDETPEKIAFKSKKIINANLTYYFDTRQYNTLNILTSVPDFPADFKIWGFADCQGQSKFVPSWRSKSVPLGLKNIGY
jgi:hypothetical protein